LLPMFGRDLSIEHRSDSMRQLLFGDLLSNWKLSVLQLRGRKNFIDPVHRLLCLQCGHLLVVDGGERVHFLCIWDLSIKHRLNELSELSDGIVFESPWRCNV
jgi:hypothetical protein